MGISTKQLYEWYFLSVCPSVRLSVCHTFFTMFPSSYGHEMFRIITNDKSEIHVKGQGQRSKVKVTEVKAPLNRFQTVTPVYIHIWWRSDAQRLMLLRRGAILFFKPSVKFLGNTAKTFANFELNWAFPDCSSSLNSLMATKWCTKLEVAWKRYPIVFQGHPSFFKVTQLKKKSSILTQIGRFRTVT